ncbi:uncharacterized protein LOC120980966 [Bufo bufo]|uniref:uncharacterized protein LOC120980966 n=1 Tax=Bufo bufo TaxID=8384 RepID=UPI001ABEAFA3|nr:uncharacterized protein LOC120980966 [Bufo bufo]
MSSAVDGDRSGRKTSSKRKHLACRDCDTPLADSYEFNRCPSCRPPPLPPDTEPTIRDVVVWVKDFVESSMNTLRDSVSSRRPSVRSPLRPTPMQEEAYHTVDEVHSSESSGEEEEAVRYFFPVEKTQRLLRSIRSGDQDVDPGEASESTSRGPRAFKVDETLSRLMKLEWKHPEKASVISKRFKPMFPIVTSQLDQWGTVPKVDLAIAKLSKRTLVPADDGSNLQDPMDRRVECTLRRSYSTAAAAASVAISSGAVGYRLWHIP